MRKKSNHRGRKREFWRSPLTGWRLQVELLFVQRSAGPFVVFESIAVAVQAALAVQRGRHFADATAIQRSQTQARAAERAEPGRVHCRRRSSGLYAVRVVAVMEMMVHVLLNRAATGWQCHGRSAEHRLLRSVRLGGFGLEHLRRAAADAVHRTWPVATAYRWSVAI